MDINYLSTQILESRGIVVDKNDLEGEPKVHGFVRAETTEPKVFSQPAAAFNPEEIAVDDVESDEDQEEIEIPETHVPDTVFGSIAASAPEAQSIGARDRFKMKKT